MKIKFIASIIVLMLIVVINSCETPDIERIFHKAKDNKKQQVCQLIVTPETLSGVYCVTYEGPAKIDGR